MEKVVISKEMSIYQERAAEEVNKYLSQGWSVKMIHTTSNQDGVFAIFVLEKK